jgi:hypothetical protein
VNLIVQRWKILYRLYYESLFGSKFDGREEKTEFAVERGAGRWEGRKKAAMSLSG